MTESFSFFTLRVVFCITILDRPYLLYFPIFQRIHTLLPPPYRDVWMEWQNTEEAAKKKVAADDVKVVIDKMSCFVRISVLKHEFNKKVYISTCHMLLSD